VLDPWGRTDVRALACKQETPANTHLKGLLPQLEQQARGLSTPGAAREWCCRVCALPGLHTLVVRLCACMHMHA